MAVSIKNGSRHFFVLLQNRKIASGHEPRAG
jgi:hypothetical protein